VHKTPSRPCEDALRSISVRGAGASEGTLAFAVLPSCAFLVQSGGELPGSASPPA
jgi:hypothetical protein